MKKYKVHYSPTAQDDLDDIWDYIAIELANPIAAENTVEAILNHADSLSNNPVRGRTVYHYDGEPSVYKRLICNSYYIFYRIGIDEVFVDRIIYTGRDYLRILFPHDIQH